MAKGVLSFPGSSGIVRDGESHKGLLIQAIMTFKKKELKAQGKEIVSDFFLPQNSGESPLRTHYKQEFNNSLPISLNFFKNDKFLLQPFVQEYLLSTYNDE